MSRLARERFFCILLLGISFLLLNLSLQNKIQGLKNFFLYLLSPSSSLATKILTHPQDLGKNLLTQLRLNEENRQLKQKIQEYIHWETSGKEILEENKRLRQIFNFQERINHRFIVARVIGRDTQSWYHSLVIDKGSAGGIKKDSPVIALEEEKEGVVGRIIEVSPNLSKVLLLTDSLSAVVGSSPRSKADGIVEGRDKNELLFKYLLPESDIQAGDLVVTSGIGGIFPPGMPIGKVIKVEEKKYMPYKEGIISPYLNFSHLREVLVLANQEK